VPSPDSSPLGGGSVASQAAQKLLAAGASRPVVPSTQPSAPVGGAAGGTGGGAAEKCGREVTTDSRSTSSTRSSSKGVALGEPTTPPVEPPRATPVPAAAVVSVASSADTPVLKGEAVAYSERGLPTIVRQVDDGTGQARTVVQNEDGTHKVFGANTINSLVGSSDDDARHWMGALKDRELHGLVHELGKRLVAGSQLYSQQRAALEAIAHQGHWQYFGLQQGAAEKELNGAYKKMAMRMHPDKNGGTEEAKRRFQQMKERYETLKEKYKPAASPDDADGPEEPGGGSTRESRSNSEEDGEDEEKRERRRGSSGSEEEAAEGENGDRPSEEDGDDEDAMGRFGGDGEDDVGRSTSEGSPRKGRRRGSSEASQTPGGRRREAYDEDEDESPRRKGSSGNGGQGGRISYDPSDRGSMHETVWRMLLQMRQLQTGLEAVKVDLHRTGRK